MKRFNLFFQFFFNIKQNLTTLAVDINSKRVFFCVLSNKKRMRNLIKK